MRNTQEVFLTATIAGYPDCTIDIQALDETSTEGISFVDRVFVYFPQCYEWTSLEGIYWSVKKQLALKYGTPTESCETFNCNILPADDEKRWFCAAYGGCDYRTVYEFENGKIELSIIRLRNAGGINVKLGFWNKSALR